MTFSVVVGIVELLLEFINVSIDLDIFVFFLLILLLGGIFLSLFLGNLGLLISNLTLEFISFTLKLCFLLLLSAFLDACLLNLGPDLISLILLLGDVKVGLLHLSFQLSSEGLC